MDDIKRCSKCKMEWLKTSLHKNKNMSDDFHPRCISCSKKFFHENREKTKK